MNCRFCKATLELEFIDLINSPASNSYLSNQQLNEPEIFYPLKVFVCESCFLVQIDEYKRFDSIFDNNYAYFSSFSTSWLEHCKNYVEQMTTLLNLNEQSQVIEIASNDGYLLQYFLPKHIKVLGIEPTKNTAEIAVLKGIPCITEFFGTILAHQLQEKQIKADLLIGNNVLAHVPDIVDFVRGLKIVLQHEGVITMEFPHLLELVTNSQFDTIYHEHFSYLSLYTVGKIFESQGLRIFKVDKLTTHGGSIRIYATHQESKRLTEDSYEEVLKEELKAGMDNRKYYINFNAKVMKIKLDLLNFLVQAKLNGKHVAAYGAAAKGNTLLNYCGVKSDMIDFVVDANPVKQRKFLPASHIPIVGEEEIKNQKPDYVLILPWNLKDEITKQLRYIHDWNGQFVIPIPHLEVI
ncbi:MAG: methyltransferase domain-containing protein [Chitinophagaceae bacterium]|nr:methyltransferase domain-containing protein [Chitinophagaceae bacterium]